MWIGRVRWGSFPCRGTWGAAQPSKPGSHSGVGAVAPIRSIAGPLREQTTGSEGREPFPEDATYTKAKIVKRKRPLFPAPSAKNGRRKGTRQFQAKLFASPFCLFRCGPALALNKLGTGKTRLLW
jgi:hypothetical protein